MCALCEHHCRILYTLKTDTLICDPEDVLLVEIQYIEDFLNFKQRESVKEMATYQGRMNLNFSVT